MCEVYRSTFETTFPLMAEAVKKAEFIAIDTEFTGLYYSNQDKPSLFDSSSERYKKLKAAVSEFLPSQIGFSAFVSIPDENKYVAHSFNTYLFPSSFGPVDVRFACQASSFEFLCKHKFDFNKFAYEGVSYLNNPQEKEIKEHLEALNKNKGLEREVDEYALQRYCSVVAEWLVHHEIGDTFILHDDIGSLEMQSFILQSEIRQRFTNVWTTFTELGHIVVEVVSEEKRKDLEAMSQESQESDEEKLLKSLLGWTRVFRLFVKHQKPIIGHNMFMDLLFLFDKFHKPLPDSYDCFKKEIHELFPFVFDTKHITSSSKKLFDSTNLLTSTNLGDLYLAFSSERGRFHTVCSPTITHADGFHKYKDQFLPHEAGFDAYQCGVLFLRLAHILHFYGVRSMDVEPCKFKSYLPSLQKFLNRVNVIRATISHITLDGADPVSRRPDILLVKSRNSSVCLSSQQIAGLFSAYGSVDIKMIGKHEAHVATGNHACCNEILRAYRKHDMISVVKYNPASRRAKILWAGAFVSGSLCIGVVYFSLKGR